MTATTIREDTTARHVSKYDNPNPVHQFVLGRFYNAVADFLRESAPTSVLDFGCGEGFIIDQMAKRNLTIDGYTGLDLRSDAVNAARGRHPGLDVRVQDLFDDTGLEPKYELVMALEVLEHLIEPERFMPRLVSLAGERLLLTVPHEPWFQLSNLVRGRDLIRLGNHPEHINHWNTKTFASFVSDFAEVESVRSVFPFVILTARPR
ncbi:MAG: class I SAM-dependent methyltransferase [Pseudomonadota bacterium]